MLKILVRLVLEFTKHERFVADDRDVRKLQRELLKSKPLKTDEWKMVEWKDSNRVEVEWVRWS